MDYQESINRLLGLVDHERAQPALPRQKRIYDLRRMEILLGRIGNPHLAVPAIHVAGTKGKGSTAALCDAALRAAGCRTGFYSSPHLHSFTERLRLDSQPLPKDKFARLVADLWPHRLWVERHCDEGPVSLFEFMTVMAFQCFEREKADFQTIEVGLGGRLDATNVVRPNVAVITSVSLDHTAILGDTLEEIAAEKAGIIKPDAATVVSPQRPPAEGVIREVCRQKEIAPILVGQDVTWTAGERDAAGQSLTVKGRLETYELRIPLLGTHQLENAATAVAALEVLREQGYDVTPAAIAEGFARTQWPCRLETLSDSPRLVADGAHNDYSVATLLDSLPDYFPYSRLLVIAGFSRDKSVDQMVGRLAEKADAVFVTRSRHPRSVRPALLADAFRQRGVTNVAETATVEEAVAHARQMAGPADLILVTGSLFVAAEARETALGIEPELYPDLLPPDLKSSGGV